MVNWVKNIVNLFVKDIDYVSIDKFKVEDKFCKSFGLE